MLPIIALLMVVAVAVILLYNFPCLFRAHRARIHTISVLGPVVIVSDIHIGSRNSHYTVLRKFIEKLNYATVVVVGDFLDKRIPFNRSTVESLIMAIRALGLDKGRVIYIASTASHDIEGYFDKALHISIDSIDIYIVSGIARITVDSCSHHIYATHGEYISRDGVAAYILDKIGRSLLGKPLTALIARKMLDIERSSWIFIGHSHIPYTDHSSRMANTGSWDNRFYAPAQPSVGIVKCINNRLYVKLSKITLR